MSIHEQAVEAAQRRQLSIPEAVQRACAVRDAVDQAQRTPAPERPALPTDPASAAETIRSYALQLQQGELTRSAAVQFIGEAEQAYAAAVAAAVPDWIAAMGKEFQALVKALAKAAERLPQDVRTERINWRDSSVTAPYQRAEAAAVQLDQLVADRNTIARAGGHDGGQDNALYAIAYLPEPSVQDVMGGRWKALSPLLTEWRELKHQPVARWVHLVRAEPITLSLATPGQVRERAAQVQAWRDAEVTRLHGGTSTSALQRVQRTLAA